MSKELTLYVCYEFSFLDIRQAFEVLGITVTFISHAQPSIKVAVPDSFGLINFMERRDNLCAHAGYVYDELSKLNPGYPITQVFFDTSDTNNQRVLLVFFDGTSVTSNVVCFFPKKDVCIIADQIVKVSDDKTKTHEFLKA